MKKSLFIFVVAWLTVGISACGTVDDLAPGDVETLGQSPDGDGGQGAERL